jgi:hypothetical protein
MKLDRCSLPSMLLADSPAACWASSVRFRHGAAASTPAHTSPSVTINGGLDNSTPPACERRRVNYVNNSTGQDEVDYYGPDHRSGREARK